MTSEINVPDNSATISMAPSASVTASWMIALIWDTPFKGYARSIVRLVHELHLGYLSVIGRTQIWQDDHGQDLIEYALMAGFVAVAAGATMPTVSSSICKIFSRVSSVMSSAAS